MPEKGGVEIEPNYHLCPKPLLEALKKAKKTATADTILVSKWGKPWASANVLGRAIRHHLIKIGLAKKGERTISMHGLRKTAASEVGGLLLGARGIKSVTGHKSDEMANYYAQHADQIEINKKVVSAWDEALAKKERKRAAARK
jgi:integrase